MSQENETCLFCGGAIVFRVIRGITTPLHQGKSDCIGRRLYRRDQEGIPHHTICPKCGAAVIFLRHNGGCIWLESIGWPWPKHPCFDNTEQNDWRKTFLPSQAESFASPQLVFARYLGRLKSHEGFVVLLSSQKKLLRGEPKYMPFLQYDILCSDDKSQFMSEKFKDSLVIVCFKQWRLLTMDGTEFEIRQHQPLY